MERDPATITPSADQPVDDEIDYDYQPPADPAAELPQVSSAIAIIRIVAVLAIGVCISLGIFIMLFGGTGIFVGGALVLLAVPVYFAMQFAERIADSSS